jgi:tetraacyldisaccharide 4'-kinase
VTQGTVVAFADALQRRWYMPHAAPAGWTLPLASLYGCVTGARRGMYRRGCLRTSKLPVPVLVVGNIVAGGAGKTPLVIGLVEALRERGWNPGVVSRGYGGSTHAPILLDARPDPAATGDEPALIRLRTEVPVAVGADRVAAARLLLAAGVDVIVADDGLQHLRLARDLEICVVDGVRRFGNARLLPAGPLREPLARLRDMDWVVCNGGEPRTGEVPMQLVQTYAVAISDSGRSLPLAGFAGTRVHAVAGIGHPARFFDDLRAHGIELLEHAFPDHHRYTPRDLDFSEDLPLLMTEKDAVKCAGFAQARWWSVPVSAALPASFFDDVAARLLWSRSA